jgi:hypothetical protein
MDVDHSLQLLLQLLIDASGGNVHHLLLHCHQSVHGHPRVTEDRQLLHPISDEDAGSADINEDYPAQSLLLIAPAQKRSTKLAPPRQLHQHILPHEYLLQL